MLTNSGFSGGSQIPQWILLNRNGVSSSQSWAAAFKDYKPGNADAVIGRFAFNVYDTGGLLDSSVAGLPVFTTALTDAQVQQLKSTQTGASLYDRVTSAAIIPGFDATKQTAFVNTWRFKSTNTSSANSLLDFMTSTTLPTFADSGFMRPTTRSGLSNSMAFSRQDLIRAAPSPSPTPFASPTPLVYLPKASLPYFTHFTRESNAPSWKPVTPAGSTIRLRRPIGTACLNESQRSDRPSQNAFHSVRWHDGNRGRTLAEESLCATAARWSGLQWRKFRCFSGNARRRAGTSHRRYNPAGFRAYLEHN